MSKSHHTEAQMIGALKQLEAGRKAEPGLAGHFFGMIQGPLAQNAANQNYKFTGKERDSESGLDNFGARYDSSNLGRFMTPDWAARPTAVPYAVFGDPQSLNLYGYVRNDPVSRADLDGHAAEADAFRNWGDWSPLSYGMFGMTTLAADLLSRSTMQNQEIRAQQQAKNEINTKPPTPDPAGVRTKPAPNRPPANSRTDVVLFGAGAGKPLIHNAIEWEMRWIAGTCSGDSCHKDDNLTITGVEIDGVKPLGPISDRPKKGEISDWISIESRKITQWWSLDGKQVQVVLGPDGKGGVVKTWGVEIQVHGGYKNPPTYSPASAIEPPQ